MATLLQTDGLTVEYEHRRALDGFTAAIDSGEAVAVLGPNGAGKTTLARALSGLVPSASGQVTFDGRRIERLHANAIARAGIGHVPEGRRVFTQLSVEENLLVGGHTLRRADLPIVAAEVFSAFPELDSRRHQKGGSLSGGQQQMLAIGRALMARPRLLILDEPTMGLAPILVKRLGEILRRLREQQGITILLIDQRWSLVEEVASRVYLLRNGVARESISVDALSPETLTEAYFSFTPASDDHPVVQPLRTEQQ